MSLSMNCKEAITAIESWYNKKCDGTWEHNLGITLESTDNPGWLFTVSDLEMDNMTLSSLVGPLLRDYHAQVTSDGMSFRIFAPSLSECILACGILIAKAE
jgi:hypothetical protein